MVDIIYIILKIIVAYGLYGLGSAAADLSYVNRLRAKIKGLVENKYYNVISTMIRNTTFENSRCYSALDIFFLTCSPRNQYS